MWKKKSVLLFDFRLEPGGFKRYPDHLPCLSDPSLEEGDRQTRQDFQAHCVSLPRPEPGEERKSVRAGNTLWFTVV